MVLKNYLKSVFFASQFLINTQLKIYVIYLRHDAGSKSQFRRWNVHLNVSSCKRLTYVKFSSRLELEFESSVRSNCQTGVSASYCIANTLNLMYCYTLNAIRSCQPNRDANFLIAKTHIRNSVAPQSFFQSLVTGSNGWYNFHTVFCKTRVYF